ncbi:MAG: glycosyltransferase [Lachnospiraceae bacterium]|nr:glycosyltransferase [Lachnospiraceae bacterium]
MSKLSGENAKRLFSYIKRNGIKASSYKAIERLLEKPNRTNIADSQGEDVFDLISDKEQEEYEREMKFTHRYKFSVIVPAYETGTRRIKEMIFSVLSQTYDNFELCIADASVSNEVEEAVKSVNSDKIKYKRLPENNGISENTNEALKMATGEYVVFLDHDDIITRNALFEVMMVLEKGLKTESGILTNGIKLIYSDEDKCNDDLTEFFECNRKPDFDINLLRTNNYICHMLTVRRELALKCGGFNKEFDGSQDHDFIFRCVENLSRDEIVHINKVLYHWRSHESSTATNPESKLYAYDAGKRAVKAHLQRLSIEADVEDTPHLGFYRVRYKVSATDLTKIKIMTLDELKSLSSDELKNSDFEYIMVLNDNIKPESADYFEEMLGLLKQEETGCVGGLVINKGKIESAGYSIDENGELKPDFNGLNKHFSGYFNRAKIVREVDGVCTDCMMVKKSAVDEGGVLKKDKIVVYCPYSVFKRV